MNRETFSRLEILAATVIEAGYPAIIDATFLRRRSRDCFAQLAQKLAVPFVIVDCMATPEQLRQRLMERERRAQDASEADVAVMEQQRDNDEALTQQEQAHCLETTSSEDVTRFWRRFMKQCFD